MRQHKLKVHEALERVRMAHPYAASGGIAPSPRVTSEAAALWTRLLELDSSALDQAIVNLSEYDVRVVLFAAAGRLGDPRALDVLERVLVVRRLLRVGEAGWLAYVVSNGRTSFRRSACHYAESESGREVWIDLAQSVFCFRWNWTFRPSGCMNSTQPRGGQRDEAQAQSQLHGHGEGRHPSRAPAGGGAGLGGVRAP